MKEATARIKINKLLEESGGRFFDNSAGKANIALERNVKLKHADIDELGENFESISNGFIDFLLLDEAKFPLAVLEAKAEDKNPLVGKEQARKYAQSQGCRFIILSNGNLHYFWDLEPHIFAAGDVMQIDPLVTSCKLSNRPATVYGKWVWPMKDMLALIERL